MPLSFVQYTADGATDTFNIPFPYISTSHLQVRVNAVLDTGITFPTASTVETSTMPPNGAIVEVRRDTPNTSRLVDFADGSLLSEEDLDKSALQNFYVMQELDDTLAGKLSLDADLQWDAENRVIKNVADGVNSQDAVTVGQTLGLVAEANTAKEAAEAAQQAAEAAQISSETAQDFSEQARDEAFQARNDAQTYANSIHIPVMTGNGGQYLRAKTDETGFEYLTQADLRKNLREVGEMLNYAGSTAPLGWLLCYGQAVSRTTYAVLFGLLGTTYGAGDGSTTFNLPDFRGRVSVGKDNMGGSPANRITSASIGGGNATTLGGTGGEETHTLTVNEIPAHTHSVVGSTAFGATGGSYGLKNASSTGMGSGFNDGSVFTVLSLSTGGGVNHSNTQPWISVSKIIFTGV